MNFYSIERDIRLNLAHSIEEGKKFHVRKRFLKHSESSPFFFNIQALDLILHNAMHFIFQLTNNFIECIDKKQKLQINYWNLLMCAALTKILKSFLSIVLSISMKKIPKDLWRVIYNTSWLALCISQINTFIHSYKLF